MRQIRKMVMVCTVLLFLVSCRTGTSAKESDFFSEPIPSESEKDSSKETQESFGESFSSESESFSAEGFQGRVIPAVYEDYDMGWDDTSVVIIGSLTYTDHYEGETEFALIGYNGTENPLLIVGCTKESGDGEYYVYCFVGNRVYQAQERLKGTLYYNETTKEFAVLDENEVWNVYTYYSNHIVWLRGEDAMPDGFVLMTMTSKQCSPPPMEQNIRSFIFY